MDELAPERTEEHGACGRFGFRSHSQDSLYLLSKMFQSRGPDSTILWVLVIEENYTHGDKIGQGTLHQESRLLCLVRMEGIHTPKILGRRRAGGENPGLSQPPAVL